MKHSQKTVFITGSTGLIGSYLTKILLQKQYKVYALARRKNTSSAEERVVEILKFWDKDVLSRHREHLRVLEGDITKDDLAIDKKILNMLGDEVDEIFHCAAITKFNWPIDKIRIVNVDGTRNVMEFALFCHERGRLKKANHISTAFVCGDYKGVFSENDLEVGQKFFNSYEECKFEAEKLVNYYRSGGLWIDIFRPSIVIGESSTGKTFSFDQSFYQVLNFLKLGLWKSLPCIGTDLNLVYVDNLANAISMISMDTRNKNKNYHIFESNPYPLKQFLDIFYDVMNMEKPLYMNMIDYLHSEASFAERKLFQYNFLYLNRNMKLESKYTANVLKENGFTFSNFSKKNIARIVKYAVGKS